MIGDILKLENLMTTDLNECFIHSDTQKLSDIVITSIIMNKDSVYLITEMPTLYQPLVCKVDRNFHNSKFVFISPSLRYIIWINRESKYRIISITKFLEFINPLKIKGFPDSTPFSLPSLGFSGAINTKSRISSDIKGQLNFSILKASWWEPDNSNSFVIFVERNGLHFLHVNHPESNLKSFPLNDVSCTLFNSSGPELYITLLTCTNRDIYIFTFENGQIVLNTQILPILINPIQPFSIQRSYFQHHKVNNLSLDSSSPQHTNWLYYTLQDHLHFYDFSYQDVKVTEFDSNSNDTLSIIITKHFIFYCQKEAPNDDNQNENDVPCKVYARFIQPSHEPFVILNERAEIHLISYEDDEVFLSSKTSMIHVSLRKEQIDIIFANLVFTKHLDQAIFIGQGLDLSIPYNFQYIINEYVKHKNYAGAFEIMQHEKCDLRDTLLRFLQNGLDRLALHVALKSHHKAPMIEKSIGLFADRVILKSRVFYDFSNRMKYIYDKTDYLLSPEAFAKTDQYDGYLTKNSIIMSSIPNSLKFRYNLSFGIETLDVDVVKAASKIDLYLYPILSFSASYKAFLNQYRAMLNETEILMNDFDNKIVTCFAFYQDSVIYLSDKHFYIGDQEPDLKFTITSFVLKGKSTLYATDSLLNVYKTELPRIDFIDLPEIHPTVKIVSNSETVAFLSVSGSIFFENGDYVTGDFIDIALGKDYVFAIDTNGELYQISIDGDPIEPSNLPLTAKCPSNANISVDSNEYSNNRNNKKLHKITRILLDQFIHAIACVGNIPIPIISKDCILINSEVVKIKGFETSTSGTNECYIGGSGEILVIDNSGHIKKFGYSQRIGSLLSIQKSHNDNSIVAIGSASSPIKVLNEPIVSTEQPSFGDLRLIVSTSSKYSEDFIFKIFEKDPYRTIFYALYGKWDQINLQNCTAAGIKSLEPYINDFNVEGSSQIFHLLLRLSSANTSDEVFKSHYARKTFLSHPEDLQLLTKKQLITILPDPSSIHSFSSSRSASQLQLASLAAASSHNHIILNQSGEGSPKKQKKLISKSKSISDSHESKEIVPLQIDSFSTKLLQWSAHPTTIPSLRFKEGTLYVFNCNHILNENEMRGSIKKVQDLLKSKKFPNTGSLINDVYHLPKIPVQCPKCLLQRLEGFFKY